MKRAYAGYLKKWIEPRWGRHALSDIRAVEVELWLKNLDRAPGTRSKIRNTMSLLFNHGRRHDLCEHNPIQWVRQSAKRRVAPDVLTTSEVQMLLANLRLRERTLVLLAVTTGLRRSELFEILPLEQLRGFQLFTVGPAIVSVEGSDFGDSHTCDDPS